MPHSMLPYDAQQVDQTQANATRTPFDIHRIPRADLERTRPLRAELQLLTKKSFSPLSLGSPASTAVTRERGGRLRAGRLSTKRKADHSTTSGSLSPLPSDRLWMALDL